MTKDEIQLALRHVAIGRVNTEAVMAFIDKLEALMAKDEPKEEFLGVLMTPEGEHVLTAPKRTRKAKAD